MLVYECPQCGEPLRIREKYVGMRGSCKKCSTRFVVPVEAGGFLPDPETAVLHPPVEVVRQRTVPRPGNGSSKNTVSGAGDGCDLAPVIKRFVDTYKGEKSRNVWVGDEVPEAVLGRHKAAYLKPSPDERVLVLLNKGPIMGVFTGIAITSRCIHFCTLKKSFFASLTPWLLKGPRGSRDIASLDSIEIAEHDTCYGTAYVGHELRINDEVLGYVRMGTGVLLDEQAIAFLNGLFDHLADNGILKRRVKEYAWQ